MICDLILNLLWEKFNNSSFHILPFFHLFLMVINTTRTADCRRAFHHYRGSKEPVPKNPELERLLNEEFRTMADFRRAKEKLALEAKEKESASLQESSSSSSSEKTPNAPPGSSS